MEQGEVTSSHGTYSVPERIQRRDENIHAELTAKKEKRQNADDYNRKNVDNFLTQFQSEKDIIESSLEASKGMEKSAATESFEKISRSIQNLQKFVTDSALFLPSYDLQKAQSVVSHLQYSLTEVMDKVIPKKKFAFKTRKKEGVSGKDEHKAVVTEAATAVSKRAGIECGFVDTTGKTLTLGQADLDKKDVDLARLVNCTVHLLGSPSAMHVAKLEHCLVLCGPVGGSIFIESCKNCVFVLAAQQIRIHSTVETSFYVHVTSKAIIEDCSALSFGTYNLSYCDLESHFASSGLDRSSNNWDKVDDFNWLAHDAKSPNWKPIELPEQKSFAI